MGTGTQTIAEGARPAPKAEAAVASKWSVTQLVRVASIAAQIALLVFIIRKFRIESEGFFALMKLVLGGFLVNYVLPQKARMPFFVLLSVVGIGLVVGPVNAAWIVALGLLLIGVAHVPLPTYPRIGLMLLVVAVLALFRGAILPAPWSSVVWPILGAMFMFRMIIYMYDLNNKSAQFSFWRATSYFFMLPNVAFTLFPVVDYQTFARTYYNTDELKIYQSGAIRLFRGVGQLLLYRLIYQNFVLAPTAIVTAADAWQHVISTFGLYFKVVGTFSVITGIMHLFGFNLPLTNNNFLLGSSFADFWRRTNIYWKDAILKLFFNPAFMRLNKKMPNAKAMGLATIYAFVLTWLLHSYQWFWIRSAFPITWQDMAMWSWLGVVLYLTMLWETAHPKKKSLKKPVRTLKSNVILALKIMGVYTAMASMWVFVWSSPGWEETKLLAKAFTNIGLYDVAYILGTIILFGVLAIAWTYTPSENVDVNMAARGKLDPKDFWRSGAIVVGGSLLIIGLFYKPAAFAFSNRLADMADRVRENKLSAADDGLLKQGYYEDLSDATRYSPELASLYASKPKDWDVNPLVVQLDDYPDWALEASKSVTFKGAKFTTNRWGMRDKDYEKVKAPGTYRMALFGQSFEQGSGVADGEAYESVFEDRLNKERVSTSSTGVQRWEVLNFANGGYGPLHKAAMLEKRGFDFGPDAILWVSLTDLEWTANEVITAHKHKLGLKMIPWAPVQEILKKGGITQDIAKVVVQQKLEPVLPEILKWVYGHVVEECRKRNIRPIFVSMAQPEEGKKLEKQMAQEIAWAKEAGFEIIDARDVYAGQEDVKKFWIAPYDHHPGVEGHRLMANKLYEQFVKLPGR